MLLVDNSIDREEHIRPTKREQQQQTFTSTAIETNLAFIVHNGKLSHNTNNTLLRESELPTKLLPRSPIWKRPASSKGNGRKTLSGSSWWGLSSLAWHPLSVPACIPHYKGNNRITFWVNDLKLGRDARSVSFSFYSALLKIIEPLIWIS